jgi:hypothetical protein
VVCCWTYLLFHQIACCVAGRPERTLAGRDAEIIRKEARKSFASELEVVSVPILVAQKPKAVTSIWIGEKFDRLISCFAPSVPKGASHPRELGIDGSGVPKSNKKS